MRRYSSDVASNVIVTGGSRGIGRAIAVRFARQGARVAICGRDPQTLRETASLIEAAEGTALTVAADLRLPESATRLVEAVQAAFGEIDILVNNAGATQRGGFLALDDNAWMDGFALKLFGAVRVTRAAWPSLTRSRGSVVNIAGIGGRTPGAQFAIGGSVNAALLSFTKSLADTGVRDGVQVNAVNPGSIRTDRLAKRLRLIAEEKGVSMEAAAASLVNEARTTRLGEPEDIANLVAFVTSAEGRFLQGSLIDMDGGQTKTL